ncbi:hypothetical protein BH24CHL9_BH24CHL9_07130 [soil metagenome]
MAPAFDAPSGTRVGFGSDRDPVSVMDRIRASRLA